jgi:putative transposase
VGISRQGVHQAVQREGVLSSQIKQIVAFAQTIRCEHPKMGARIIYRKMAISPDCRAWFDQFGRDKVEAILLNNGFRVVKAKNYHKTTVRGYFVFKNLIVGILINAINQVWVSDITYYFVVQMGVVTHYYLTFIMDLCSRRIIGFAVSDNLTTESTTLPALKMALEVRHISENEQINNLILHSDGGGQYADKNFLLLMKKHGIASSMGKQAYDNPNAERVNGTIKNDYLLPWEVNSFSKLELLTPKAVKNYNQDKPHSALKGMSPIEFEKNCKTLE